VYIKLSPEHPKKKNRRRPASLCLKATLLAGLSGVAASGAKAEDESDFRFLADASIPFERITVVGSRERQYEIPGAATFIGPEELEAHHYGDIHRILRMVPGVNIQEEDGFGLRPNIGLRGTGIDRSSKITLMEDGVLIAPAPYAAPAAYYFPTAGRLEAVEVRKGSSAIKFGPRTIGGAINLISTQIPEENTARLRLRGGEHGSRELHGVIGGNKGPFGALFETLQASSDGFKRLSSGGGTGFRIEDYVAKFSLSSDGTKDLYQTFELKLGLTDQRSRETYLGLTDVDFADDPLQRYAASANDVFNSRHYQIQASHHIELSPRFDLTTFAYLNQFERDWFKLDDLDLGDGRGRIRPSVIFEDPSDPLNQAALRVLKGEVDSIDEALQLRHNNREYQSWGVQTMLNASLATGSAEHEIQIGLRYHEDEEDRLEHREKFRMEAARMIRTSLEAPGSLSNRVASARAFAAFIQDEIVWGAWRLVPGVRLESIHLERLDYSKSDPDRLLGPSGVRRNHLSVVIPGLGVAYQAKSGLTLLAGVHKGFSPPSPGDAEARVEESINLEAGLRMVKNGLRFEAIGFYTRYSNLVGICSNAVGCTAGEIGDQFNGGRAGVKGIEMSGSYLVGLKTGLSMPISFSYTYTEAKFRSNFADSFWGDVETGDRLPYISPHQLHGAIGLEGMSWDINLNLNYTSATRSQAGQGPIPDLEKIGARTIFDLGAGYDFGQKFRLFLSVDNLFDKVYIAARRPYGARPGKPRTITGGLEVTF
jgi:Fe(3+) dicitrate transport protein